MTSDDDNERVRVEYSAAMASYQTATDALKQFDQELFDGLMLDFEAMVQESQKLKAQEESAYRQLSRAREGYNRLRRDGV